MKYSILIILLILGCCSTQLIHTWENDSEWIQFTKKGLIHTSDNITDSFTVYYDRVWCGRSLRLLYCPREDYRVERGSIYLKGGPVFANYRVYRDSMGLQIVGDSTWIPFWRRR